MKKFKKNLQNNDNKTEFNSLKKRGRCVILCINFTIRRKFLVRKKLYKENSANYPRLKTDAFFSDYDNIYSYTGFINDVFLFIEKEQLLKPSLWRRFVQQFREDADYESGWRGEFWGKMMRGACFVYSYTRNDELYDILTQTVSDMINSADEDSRISSYGKHHEFEGWDMWCRKYVLLGMQYFIEICKDESFKNSIISSMCKQVDYIISKIGNEEGKISITSTTNFWRGLNSSSILEPVVRLYSLTGERKYLDFADYIVSCGGTEVANIFELAYENNFSPYQYPVTKAYEMISCFEGLLEYYRITLNEKHKTAIINFADKILETDFTVIGCCGCTLELFDHSTVRQANTTNGNIMQETCVTVTIMKFLYQLNLITGNSKYADAFEISLYNAYLGSLNTEKEIEPYIMREYPQLNIEPLPFSSYSPLVANTRGNDIGGFRIMSDNHYYGCCACIGSAGVGLVPKMQFLTTEHGFVMNLYINGKIDSKTPMGNDISFETKTAYPKNGKIRITVSSSVAEKFEIRFRNPYWSKTTTAAINDQSVEASDGYISITREWKCGDVIELNFDMSIEAIHPIPYGSQILMNKIIWQHNYMVPTFDKEDPKAKRHVALRRGPIMLAQDERLGYSADFPVEIQINNDNHVDGIIPDNDTAPYPHIVEVKIPLKSGEYMSVTDYSSAGKLFSTERKMAVWILTKE